MAVAGAPLSSLQCTFSSYLWAITWNRNHILSTMHSCHFQTKIQFPWNKWHTTVNANMNCIGFAGNCSIQIWNTYEFHLFDLDRTTFWWKGRERETSHNLYSCQGENGKQELHRDAHIVHISEMRCDFMCHIREYIQWIDSIKTSIHPAFACAHCASNPKSTVPIVIDATLYFLAGECKGVCEFWKRRNPFDK